MHALLGAAGRTPRQALLATLLAVALLLAALATAPAGAAEEPPPYADPVPSAPGYSIDELTVPTPGIEHIRLTRSSPRTQVHALRLAPSVLPRLRVITASSHTNRSPARETTTSMCRRTRCVAAINGDYFALADGIPTGPVVANGELRFSPGGLTHGLMALDTSFSPAAYTTDELEWRVTVDAGETISLDVHRVNRDPAGDNLVLYTARHGARTSTPVGSYEITTEIVGGAAHPVGTSTLRVLSENPNGNSDLAPGTVVLSARGPAADQLREVWDRHVAGESDLDLTIDIGNTMMAIGGSPVLLRDGLYHFPWEDASTANQGRRPRTLVGWTLAGEMLLIAVDGDRPGHSVGVNLPEAAQLLVRLGAVEGVMLDGGGSTTMVVGTSIRNRPSSTERQVASALVVLSEWGSNIQSASAAPIDPACPPTRVSTSGFRDLGTNNVHALAVDCTAWWAVAQGRTADSFAPTAPVTRAQMATFLVRLIQSSSATVPTSVPDAFADDDAHTHEANINRLAALDVVAGRTDGSYGPNAPVTRAQMGTFLARTHEVIAGEALAADADYFEDDTLDAHERNVNAVAQAGIAAGITPVRYDPSSPVRRDQMATFLARFLAGLVVSGRATVPA